ncbi:MAG: (2Fe-2S)-binding protein [Pyrinomonadaceae bacterium]|nr:(2Fe-2S)-binding protein [Pyrinomonadaceae bacterium]MCX7640824.1 (2Fe-2S)-binding protein [Pyrinomonadaceae bacterium]MDW8303411.1 2Fe-2S iron-sulfur cluster-binding protein [Acidobacteriota bacterium]
MARVVAETANGTVTFEAENGRKLVLCLEDNGVDILHRCGGNARCTTCRVEVISGEVEPMSEVEKSILSVKPDVTEKTRLSCQIRVVGDLHVRVINQASVKGIDPGPRPSE